MKTKPDTNPWSFVEKWYPNYYQSDEIARADDLAKIIHDEINVDSAAEDIFINECDENMEVAREKYNALHVEIYEVAITNYMKSLT